MKKTLLNIFYNAIYQIFLVLVPLITVLYLSRVLGPNTYGIYSSVDNMFQFLMIFCTLSISYIEMKTISRIRAENPEKDLTEASWGLWCFQGIAGLVTIALTVLISIVSKAKYWNYILLMVPFLISAQLDIVWFFQDLADFGRVILRNTIVKLISVLLILVLVKEPSDLYKYMLIMSVSTMLGSFVFWFNIRGYIGRPTKYFYKLRVTSKAIITLLISQIAIQIYTSLDKPVLDFFQNTTQVFYYDNSQRITNMILEVIISIALVMMPGTASEGKETQKKILRKSLEATVMLGTLFSVIVMVNTKEFAPFFFGEKYIPVTPLMFLFTLTITFIPMDGVFANQFALANKRDKGYATPVCIGAMSGVLLSIILDRQFGAIGALISTLTTEAIVLVLRIWVVRDGYELKYVFKDISKYFIIGIVSLSIGMLVPQILASAFFNMASKLIIVMLIYLGSMFMMKLDFNQDILNVTNRSLRRNR